MRTRRGLCTGALLAAAVLLTGACSQATGSGTTAAPSVLPVAQPGGTGSPASGDATGTGAASASSSASAITSASAAATADSALAGKTVVLDPGHDGGNESHPSEVNKLVPQGFGQSKPCDNTGTNGDDGYPEHEFTFTVALLVQQILQQHGLKVILTRTNDTGVGPCVNIRAQIGNDAPAAAAVSIHADGNYGGHGYQILEAVKSVGGPANDAKSHQLAVAMHNTFSAESGFTPSTYAGVNGYEPRTDIAGLNLSTVPKVLVECGNMRDSGDLSLEESPTGRQHIAQAIADGIMAFLSS
ncbi:MAG TPA: N-acetylmuramoyl-L-alanine amidase [Actinocrinis sp.]|nr:N-acetylmuramoyl-L-alanine amidase [Actinocrinis sp.]